MKPNKYNPRRKTMDSHSVELPIIAASASIDEVKTTRDRGLKLTLYTERELTPEEMAVLFALRGSAGTFAFKHGEFSEEYKLPDIAAPKVDGKTPSQRLRAVFYKLWVQNDEGKEFELYYNAKMEMVIEHYKAKIDQ